MQCRQACCLTSGRFSGHCFRVVATFISLGRFALLGPTPTLQGVREKRVWGGGGGGGHRGNHKTNKESINYVRNRSQIELIDANNANDPVWLGTDTHNYTIYWIH